MYVCITKRKGKIYVPTYIYIYIYIYMYIYIYIYIYRERERERERDSGSKLNNMKFNLACKYDFLENLLQNL